MKVPLEKTELFKRIGFSGNVFIPSGLKKGFNALLVTVDGQHPKKRMLDTTRVYFVIEGEGEFVIDNVPSKVSPYDLYVIEPSQEYSYKGKMKLFEFNVSPDNSFKDVVL